MPNLGRRIVITNNPVHMVIKDNPLHRNGLVLRWISILQSDLSEFGFVGSACLSRLGQGLPF